MKEPRDSSTTIVAVESHAATPPTGTVQPAAEAHEYQWTDTGHTHIHEKLMAALMDALGPPAGRSLIDLECGNGSLAGALAAHGFSAVGVDVTSVGIEIARKGHPDIPFTGHDPQAPLPARLRHTFDVALSAEVIEHMYLPRELFRRTDEAPKPGGVLALTMPITAGSRTWRLP